MTMHETLWVLKAVHDHVAASVSNPGSWCWPTFDLLSSNVRANRHLLSTGGWREQLKRAESQGWARRVPCQPHCHAGHVTMTASGEAVLARMNAQGCCRNCACRAREADIRLARRVERRRA